MKQVKHPFSLVEIIVTVAIIGILVAIGIGVYSHAMNSAKESATQSAMKQIELALESMKAKYGYYPLATTTGNNSENRIYLLDKDENLPALIPNTGADKDKKPLIGNIAANNVAASMGVSPEYIADFVKQIDIETLRPMLEKDNTKGFFLVDSWGSTILYRSPGNINRSSYDLISAGPNGKFGNFNSDAGTDLTNLVSGSNKNYEAKDFVNSDDLTNF